MKKTSFSTLVALFALLLGANTSILAQVTTFNFNGSTSTGNAGIGGTPQTYVVPPGVTQLGIDMWGGAGGWPCCSWSSAGAGGPRANGGRVQCTMSVTPGTTLYIYVGGQGADNYNTSVQSPGGWNGGGIGGASGSSFCAAGGGASDIRTSTVGAYAASVLVVAGAGGGGGDFGPVGGAGGGLTGAAGAGGGACGGGQSGPSCATGVGLGTLGTGGSCVCYSAGGGGGGYWGGNGGVVNNGAGGGGSSFTHPTLCTSVVHTQGYTLATGNGKVIITELCTNPAAVVASTSNFCGGGTATFTDPTSGGTWASSNPSVASVGSTTGLVTGGSSVGTANISYIVPGGCFAARTITNNATPSISSITSNSPVCSGNTLTLTANTPANVTAYSWSGPGALATASTSIANVPSAPTSATGTYSLLVTNGVGVGCSATYTSPASVLTSPAAISGTAAVCATFSSVLTNSVAGGTWSSTNSSIVPVTSTGGITGMSVGTATISYTLASGCAATRVATVNALPLLTIAPSTASTICLNSSSTFTAAAAGSTFTWAGISGAAGLSCTSCAGPAITPTAVGDNIYSVTATTSAGCSTTSGVTITVNDLPADITGSSNVCIGTSTALSSGTGGTWSSSDVSIATVGVASGLVTGANLGAVTISYTLPTGCRKTANMTVLSTPAAISGTAEVCVNSSVNLSHPDGGGVWSSSNTGVATVNPAGTVLGIASGLATISYTLPTGCIVTTVATVNALPAAIGGTAVLCQGESTTLTDADAGGMWTSSNGNATVGATSGIVTGVTAGNSVITYTLPNTCYRTANATINTLPAPIGGTLATCNNTVTAVTDATSGGTWASSNASIAFIDASGTVTAIGPGFATISYTLSSGCRQTATFTVNALPANISGTLSTCQGNVSTLTNADGGGTWASSNTATASVNASGEVTGGNAGVATITYTLATGCRKTASFTVNALPIAISGTAVACQTETSMLYDFTPGGSWTSGAPGVASVDPSGLVTGGSAGLANITYSLSTGCMRTQIFTVNALPGAITGTMDVCVGQTTLLTSTTSGGSWSSTTLSAATINASGLVTGVASGNAIISYILPTGCSATASVTTNPLPATITGTPTVCEMSTTSLNNGTSGGAWTSESDPIATVSSTGVVTGVTAGNVNITYTLATGCYRTRSVLVNPLPAAITGNSDVCVGANTTLSNATSGGTWSSTSTGVASINALSGQVNGIAAGSTNISFTLPTGCRTGIAFAVNPLPASITGLLNVCEGSTTTLSNTTGGGLWDVANTSIATINVFGVVTGASAGTTAVSYILPTGCMKTANVRVNPIPAPISGSLNVCQGGTTSLSDANSGGAWTSSNIAIASVNSLGIVSGNAAGSANITYSLPTSCKTIASVVVNPLPAAIAGSTQVCVSASTILSNTTINGTWSSSNTLIADVDGSGAVSGVSAGNATISYILPTGCFKTSSIVVNPLPAVVTGPSVVCQGSISGFGDATSGGSWSSSNTSIASITGAGVVTAMAPGAVSIAYTLPTTGCARSASLVVDPVPAAISGPNAVCVNATALLGNTTPGGFWTAASPVASVSFFGEVLGNSAGTVVMTYMLPSGCLRTKVMTVNALPAVISGTDNVCVGSQVTISNSSIGGTWNTNSTAHATIGATNGLVTGVSAGSMLVSYTLPTGCKRVKTMMVNPTPDAITGNMEMCIGSVSTLITTSTGGVWLSGNTSVASIGLVGGNVTGLSAGNATISYTMPTGCMTTAMVTIDALPAAISGVTSVCSGSVTVLTNATLGGIWSSSGTAASISPAGVVSGISVGNAMVTYTLPTSCYITANVVVNPLPVAQTVTGGGSYCAGGSGVIVGLDGSALNSTYKLWKDGSSLVGTFSGTGAPMFFGSYTSGGNYTVTALTANGCMANMGGSATVTIIPIVTPAVSVNSAAGDTTCQGTSVTFSATATNGGTSASYLWMVNGMAMSTSNTYSYTPANGDVVSVMLTSSANCAMPATASGSKMMHVMTVETPSIAIGVSPSASICKGSSAVFTTSPANGGSHPTYSWMKNGVVPMGTGATLTYAPNNNDVITCMMHSNYRCPSTNDVVSNNVMMRVDEIYVPQVELTVTPGTTVNAGQQVIFDAIVTNAGPTPTYMWMKNGFVITGATQGSYQASNFKDGDSITCIVTGSGSCGQMTANSAVLVVLPSTGVITTSIANGDISLIPNPNNGSFRVTGTLATTVDQTVNMEITDVLGQVVYRNTVNVVNGKMDVAVQAGNTLANGMYMLNMQIGSERKAFHFVIKQ